MAGTADLFGVVGPDFGRIPGAWSWLIFHGKGLIPRLVAAAKLSISTELLGKEYI